MADVIINSDGHIFTVPEMFARTESQLRWLNQTTFTGCEDEIQIPVDVWDLYHDYSKNIVYRSTKQAIKDSIGRLFRKHYKFRKLLARAVPMQYFKIQRWSIIVAALEGSGKKLKWRVI